ncbi:hypothetical protein FACS1894133_5800 [Clostridia bacterium]|nr:hypothetical protein FACS1894133_5800 [Clostridia bacterium]
MNKVLYKQLGECTDDEDAVRAVAEWITASDRCARSSDEDFSNYWRICSEAQDRLHRYFSDEDVEAFVIKKDEIRQILSENIKGFGTI